MKRGRLILVALTAAVVAAGCGDRGDVAGGAVPPVTASSSVRSSPAPAPAEPVVASVDTAPMASDLGAVEDDLSALDAELEQTGSDLSSTNEGGISE
jgi:hypothetical protein